MSGSVNSVIIVGNLARDPEARQAGGGQIVNMTVATSERWKDKATGERQEKTEFHRVVIFNDNLAGIAMQYLSKGSKVAIQGKLQTRKWTDKDGVDRYSTEIVIDRFRGELTLLGDKGDGANQQDTGGNGNRNIFRRPSSPGGGYGAAALDDDIPFAPW